MTEAFERSTEEKKESKKVLMERLTRELPVLRARLGVSQADVADAIGVARQTYNNYETGKKEMPWSIFLALVTVFQSNKETQKMLSSIEGLEDYFDNGWKSGW